jgi:uncharacterized protein
MPPRPGSRPGSRPTPVSPLTDREREQLQALLDALPAPLEPPDISALDGFLVGVLLQPQPVPEAQWLAQVHDFDGGRAAPAAVDLTSIQALARRRHAELAQAIAARRWFDPWVFELEPESSGEEADAAQMVLPWIAGLAAALERFPALLAAAGASAQEPLGTLYAYFDAADLEDVGELAPWIEQAVPADSAEDAVEDLVRCTLLLADAMQPPRAATPPRRSPSRR